MPNGMPFTEPKNGFRAWSDTISPKRITIDHDFGMHIQAHAIDRIFKVSPIFTEQNFRRQCLEEFSNLPNAEEIGDEAQFKLIDDFWRTLVLDYARLQEHDVNLQPGPDVFSSFASLGLRRSI